MTPEEALAKLRREVDRARGRAGLTKAALAARTRLGHAAISRTTVQQFFRDDGYGPVPSVVTVTALAAALRLDAQPLLDLRDLAAGTANRASGADTPGTAFSRMSSVVPQGRVRPPRAGARLIGVIPPAALAFQHRGEADQLRSLLDNGGTAVLHGRVPAGTPVAPLGVALVGMGGVGKSQLAADHARAALTDGSADLVVWVTATDRSAVVDRLAEAGRELGSDSGEDPEQAARAFLAWLTPKAASAVAAPRRWLVVLDDLSRPEDLHGLWPPASPHGRTLITTRRQDAALTGLGRVRLEVGVFASDQATAHLAEALAAYGRMERAEELAALAADLGHLPLALSQAAAYLADTGATVTAYRQALADRATTLAELAPDVLPDEQSHAVAAAWALSVDHADTLRPAGFARALLQLSAYLDPNGIPGTVLTSLPARMYLTYHRNLAGSQNGARLPEVPEPVEVAEREVFLGLSALRRLSLIQHDPAIPQAVVRVHQLVQRAIRDTLSPDQHDRTARAAADALIAAWPNIENDTILAQALRSNTTALTRCAESSLVRTSAHRVLYLAGNSLGWAGQFTAARDHFDRLTDTTTCRLGPDHPSALAARHRMAYWRGKAGDPSGAADALAELLIDRTRVLGPDHAGTLSTRYALALWRGEAGDPDGAAAALADVLNDRLRILGPDHSDTFATRHELARWLGNSGDPIRAVAAFKDLIPDVERVLGPNHPGTLASRLNLAYYQGKAGDPDGAAAALADALNDRVRVLGPDHPDTLHTRHILALWQGAAGDPDGAAIALADVLKDLVRVLGPDHPDTLRTKHELARWRRERTVREPPASDRS
ncbi:tetratricopeptide repeat protein [Streptomyces sp. PAN_FS17]|uniref:tetratricopeptide repeat protein n=1 Tax=Streptomyces sp. PAN_FS17 TaxID=1855351 RepID=UPI00089B86AD|nr:tetratricopeptide repeat protein [Streptomyces sp. PAN_FS17]SEB58918.1 Tetratricopeptide repeat-containing protein [Streptomyces sp. PAN_FS17]